jgi:hypothetical protein
MVHDIIDWFRIKKLIVDIAEEDRSAILFNGDKAALLGYTEIEQKIAEQVIQNTEPMSDSTKDKLKRMFRFTEGLIKFTYISEVQLVFVVFQDKRCFVVIDESALL